MKVGDLITYKQRPDLAAHPTPFRRLGTIVGENGNPKAVPCLPTDNSPVIFEVYWWDSENIVSYEERGLDYPSLETR